MNLPTGGSATYTVTVAAGQGFSCTVNLAVSGLPKFANPKFTPTAIVNSGSSALMVNTNRNVATGHAKAAWRSPATWSTAAPA